MKNIIAPIVILLTFSIVAYATPVFTISGTITDSSGSAIPETYEITVENQTRALSQTGTIYKGATTRKYTAIFVTIETDGIVAAVGDKLQISVEDGDKIIMSQSYTITETDITRAHATINIKIPLDDTEIKSINIIPQTVSVRACQTQQFTVSANGSDLPSDSVTWEVIGDIGEIGNEGRFTAKKPGDGKIKATLKSNPEITAETGPINVTYGAADKLELSANPTAIHPGDKSMLTIKVTDACDNPVPNEKVDLLLEGRGDLGQVVDNGDGTYIAEYIAGNTAGEALIKAFIGDKSDTVTVTVYTEPITMPELHNIFPTSGPIEGGTEVIITGKGFTSEATVTIGGKESKVLYVNQQGTEIAAETPVISIRELLDDNAPKDVKVTNPDGQSDTLKEAFQYYLLYTLSLAKGWNLISFPGDVIELSPDGFFGTQITQILNADYNTPDAFELGEGYWVYAIKDIEKQVQLIPEERYIRSVKRGWKSNLIGGIYGGAPMPEGLLQLHCWKTKENMYKRASIIEDGVGYWALAIRDSEITVEIKPPEQPTAPPLTPDATPLFQLPLWVDYPNRPRARLVIGIHPDAKLGWDSRFDIAFPPSPPSGELPNVALLVDGDLPLRLTKQILPVPKTGEAAFLLQVTNNKSDAMLSWDATQIPDDWSFSLIDQTRQIDMAQQSTYSLPKSVGNRRRGEREIVLALKQKTKQQLPKLNALLPNYPNPFNPETWIPYQLAKDSTVTLTIYDISGNTVRQLFLGKKAAGDYGTQERAAHWDGHNQYGEPVASGVYFYQLHVACDSKRHENFTATRKMCIAK